jgi:hypothetical protein
MQRLDDQHRQDIARIDAAMLPADVQAISTQFGRWATLQLRGCRPKATVYRLAKEVAAVRDLGRSAPDARRHENPKNLPQREMRDILAGEREPGPETAYRIARALRRLDSTTGAEEYGACVIDGLLHAGWWPDVIGLVGTLAGRNRNALNFEFADRLIAAAATGDQIGAVFPEHLDAALDLAWSKWRADRNPRNLPPLFGAAYLLARSPSPTDWSRVEDILETYDADEYL